jgi:hypothetical protein
MKKLLIIMAALGFSAISHAAIVPLTGQWNPGWYSGSSGCGSAYCFATIGAPQDGDDYGFYYGGQEQRFGSNIHISFTEAATYKFSWFAEGDVVSGAAYAPGIEPQYYTGPSSGSIIITVLAGLGGTFALDTLAFSENAIAGWSLAEIAVPIPAAAFMFAPALLGFMGFRRKMQA